MVTQAVGTLSGGEKARLVLAMLVWQRPNLLLLDEPTNHLDLTTREALSMALNEFEGTVMLVSHDRALLREVCDEFWLVAGGVVKPFDGDLDDYQKWLLEQSREHLARPRPPRAAPRKKHSPQRPAKSTPLGSGNRKQDRKAAAAARQHAPKRPSRCARSSPRSTTAWACCSASASAPRRSSPAPPSRRSRWPRPASA